MSTLVAASVAFRRGEAWGDGSPSSGWAWAIVAGTAAVMGGVYLARRGHLAPADAWWAVPLVATMGSLAYGFYSADQSHNSIGGRVHAYCAYGAVSEAQLEGCVRHVRESDVASKSTHAAQFANGTMLECLSDSGPFCEDELRYMSLDAERP